MPYMAKCIKLLINHKATRYTKKILALMVKINKPYKAYKHNA